MAKFHLHLKGYVGGPDFSSRAVDRCMEQNADSDVRVLIDSTGGSLGTALSIASAFRRHGAVDCHFSGLNASAATVASLGARTVTIDREAMYLVHKCSTFVFSWADMNADELAAHIKEMEKTFSDLSKIDENIAAMYALRCKKSTAELLDLMKEGKWLNAKEALEWGFVDQITDYEEDQKPRVSNSLAADLRAAGLPLPGRIQENTLQSVLQAVRDFFTGGKEEQPEASAGETPETKAAPEANAAAPSSPSDSPTASVSASASASASTHDTSSPADTTSEIKDTPGNSAGSDDAFARYMAAAGAARDLYDSLP